MYIYFKINTHNYGPSFLFLGILFRRFIGTDAVGMVKMPFGLSSGALLAPVVGVLIEVPGMLMLVGNL